MEIPFEQSVLVLKTPSSNCLDTVLCSFIIMSYCAPTEGALSGDARLTSDVCRVHLA